MSDRLPWFRCFPSALLGAMAGLEADESLIYLTVLLRIYETGGPVHETGRSLARRTGLTERRAAAALDRLISAKKVANLGDHLIDSASTHDEIKWQNDRRNDQSTAGKASAAKRQNASSGTKNAASAVADDANGTEKGQRNQQDGATGDERPSNHLDTEEDRFQVKPAASPETLARESFPPKAFDAFWLRYPNKVGKGAAEASFDRIRKSGSVTFPNLMSGLDRYIHSKPPDRAWCNPATWLNQRRWDDEPTASETRSLFGQSASGDRRSGTVNAAVSAAVARHASRDGFGHRSGADDPRSRDEGHRRTGRDDPEVEDADWSPAGRYSAAH
jgi:hypothetical protein